MIALAEFRKLRLQAFMGTGEVTDLAGWEFLDRMWVGEAVGFSEWLRLADDPENLASLALDLAELPLDVGQRVLDRLQLPLAVGMSADDIVKELGAPFREDQFASAADRRTYYFRIDDYIVSCTVLNDGGLAYVVVARSGVGLED